jgi:hypothetical protein
MLANPNVGAAAATRDMLPIGWLQKTGCLQGTYTVISNSANMVVAYALDQSRNKGPVVLEVIALNKVDGQMIGIDDIAASATNDASYEPGVERYACQRVN